MELIVKFVLMRGLILFFVVVGFNCFSQTTPNCTDISNYVIYPAPLTQAQINSINSA